MKQTMPTKCAGLFPPGEGSGYFDETGDGPAIDQVLNKTKAQPGSPEGGDKRRSRTQSRHLRVRAQQHPGDKTFHQAVRSSDNFVTNGT